VRFTIRFLKLLGKTDPLVLSLNEFSGLASRFIHLQIWKIHKRVCGKNPFEWPPLNDSEAEEIFELRNELCSTTESKNLLEMIADTYGGRRDCDKAVAFEVRLVSLPLLIVPPATGA
jgi:hypothetical protein